VENGAYGKAVVAVSAILALCIVTGALIPGSPVKPIIEQAAAGMFPGAGNAPGIATSQESGHLSMSAALELSRSNEAASAWSSLHGGRELSQARTGHMDVHGKASEWELTYVDGRDVLLVNIQNGRVVSSNTYTSGASVMLGMGPEGLVDSPAIMDTLAASCPGLAVSEGSMPFSMGLCPGASPTYLVEYGGSGIRPGFSAVFDARTGELLESTYGSVSA